MWSFTYVYPKFLFFILCVTRFKCSGMAIGDLYEADQCRLENGAMGVCKKLPDCPSRVKDVLEGRRTSTAKGRCGFDGFTEIVCCPYNITDKVALRPSEIACQQYENEVIENEGVEFHILGGTKAEVGEFPYMVALGYASNDEEEQIQYFCGGTLISSQHVLTAAHCANTNKKTPIEVRLGDADLKSNVGAGQRIPIRNITFHPQYKRTMNYNDIAIIKLQNPVRMTNVIKPICLETKALSDIDRSSKTSFVVIGWGATSLSEERSSKLMKTPSLEFIDRNSCGKLYRGFFKLPRGLDESMLCAKDRNETRGADACWGDSGGPLLMISETSHSIVAVTAFGQACGGAIPGIYTAIHPYLDWIEEQVWGN